MCWSISPKYGCQTCPIGYEDFLALRIYVPMLNSMPKHIDTVKIIIYRFFCIRISEKTRHMKNFQSSKIPHCYQSVPFSCSWEICNDQCSWPSESWSIPSKCPNRELRGLLKRCGSCQLSDDKLKTNPFWWKKIRHNLLLRTPFPFHTTNAAFAQSFYSGWFPLKSRVANLLITWSQLSGTHLLIIQHAQHQSPLGVSVWPTFRYISS